MKQILYEQLPPELFALITKMSNEITELKRMIQEGETNVAISEAEFNLVKERVGVLEGQLLEVKETLKGLSIDPVAFNNAISQIASINSQLEELVSFDKNSASATNNALNRITSIETNHVNLSLRDLVLPTTTTTNIELVEIDDYLSTFIWSSSNPSIISQTGIVNRPSASEGNMNVVLTATATYGSSEAIKTFIVSVPAADMTDDERLEIVVETFDYSVFTGSQVEDSIYISTDQLLPTEVDGVSVSWSSSNQGVFTDTGVITRSPESDETVFLTATLSFNGASRIKVFTVIVEQAESIVPEPEPTEPTEPTEPEIDSGETTDPTPEVVDPNITP